MIWWDRQKISRCVYSDMRAAHKKTQGTEIVSRKQKNVVVNKMGGININFWKCNSIKQSS